MSNKSFFVFTSIFLIFSISMLTIAIRGDFTIEKFWKKDGIITFDDDLSTDLEGDLFDFETTLKGKYEYNGSSSNENLVFNYTLISPAEEYLLEEDEGLLSPDYFVPISANLRKGDSIDYNFSVTDGYIDFIIFNETLFWTWWGESDEDQIDSIDIIHTNTGYSGTFTASSPGNYVFIWWNNPKVNTNPVFLHFRLDARLVEVILKSEYIELDPYILETSEGEEFTSLGMDTSDWVIEDKVIFEIDDKDAEFTIIREDEFKISYNNKSTEISCWVLELEDFETKDILVEDTLTYKTDYILWKSKYSGITLKSITDSEVYNSTSALVATYYEKYTVKSAENVLLAPKSSGILFPFVTTLIGILILILYNKKRKAFNN
ncbi:MAG: hypothetical protein ACFE95_05875 [Candidatus Hodarchaeota archaeon]